MTFKHHTCLIELLLLSGVAIASISCTNQTADEKSDESLIINETFDQGMENWWVEGGEETRVENQRLHMRADPDGERSPGYVATAWNRTPISGNVRIEMKAHIISSKAEANNINVFFFYSDPDGTPIYDTRDMRASADYGLYHDINGYIVTYVRNEDEEGTGFSRYRLRRNPGFNLMDESREPVVSEPGRTYDLTIIRNNGKITFSIDGTQYLEWEDEEPLVEGLLGLRTFRTYLWWDDIRVYQLD